MSIFDIFLFALISSVLLIIIFYFLTKKAGINALAVTGIIFPFLLLYYLFHTQIFNVSETFFSALLIIVSIFYINLVGICLLFSKKIIHI